MQIDIVETPIDVEALIASVQSDECGGVVTFLGTVRNRANDGREVRGLEYEAHREMALAEFVAIAEEARAKFTQTRIGIVHRVGTLAVGDVAVAVCATAPHRGEAFDACEYAIDQLKHRAPIWKKERYLDGTGEWIENAC